MTYTPKITVRIPADIPTEKHAAILADFTRINTLLAKSGFQTRKDAEVSAAWALHNSKHGACGIADAVKGRP